MQLNGWHIFVLMIISFVLGWFFGPRNEMIRSAVNPSDYIVAQSDTVIKYVPFQVDNIVYKNVKPSVIRDTIYIDSLDRSYLNDLVIQYESLTQKLIENGFERIKEFNRVTPDGDSIYIELASVKDLILRAELKLAVREVPTYSYNSYLKPKEIESEAWYIKPAIAISSVAIGYGIGVIR